MNWASLIGNIASGGLLGLVGQLAVGWMSMKEKAQANAHELALMEAQRATATEVAAGKSFDASQVAETSTAAGISTWAANIKTLWRPALTLLLLALTSFIYFTASAEVRTEISGEIVTATTACVFWWFGSRQQRHLRASK